MSRRQEIKRKEELQARFQLAISNNNQKALSWLKPHKDSSSTKLENVEDGTEDSFLNLQIVPQGLSLSCKKNENNQKIGEFLSSKDISKSKHQLNQQQQQQGIRNKTNSKPMLALMNKLRDNNRKNIQQNHKSAQLLSNKKKFEVRKQKPSNLSEDEDDEDEDELDIRSRSAKKGSSLLLEQKLNKGNGKKKGIRPF